MTATDEHDSHGAFLLKPDQLQAAAKQVLPSMVYDYYAGGADDELTLTDNRSAFDQLRLRPRVLVDVGTRDLSVRVLGEQLSMPVAVAPTAYQRLAHPEGELAVARGTGRAGTAMIVSTMATTSVTDIAREATGPLWYQLYVLKDRGATRSLIQRAVEAGCSALMITVDAPMLGRRIRDVLNRFALPPGLTVSHLEGMDVPGLPAGVDGSQLAEHFKVLMKSDLTWEDLDWMRAEAGLPLILKGVVTGEDARLAVNYGVDAVVVSNHGGRQLDGAIATMDALPEVVEAAVGELEVWVDGGVRRGTDVVKALALGADLVLVGRPVLWGLAIAGSDGVWQVLDALRDELDRALALCGCRTPAELTSAHVTRVEGWRPTREAP